jgi:hypothetical protein
MKVTKSLEKVLRFACHSGNVIMDQDGRYFDVREVNEIVLELERKINKLEKTIEDYESQAIESEMGYDM